MKSNFDKVRPAQAINSLQSFNEKVVMLVGTIRLALDHKLIDEKISAQVKEAMNAVNEFYEQ